MTEVFQSYRPYDHKLGEKQTVLVTEEAHDKEHWVGHNKYYEQVILSCFLYIFSIDLDKTFKGKR